jgi:hypothetical protein
MPNSGLLARVVVRGSNHLPCPGVSIRTHDAFARLPPQFGTFKQAQRVKGEQGAQLSMM